jgi:hypothetical protein
MRPLVLVAALAGCMCVSPTSLCTPDAAQDHYDAKLVRSWVELPSGVPEGSSFLEKTIYRSGDRIALGIAHGFTRNELLDSDRLTRVLSIIRLSFSQPEYIAHHEDRDPAVTMLLLAVLDHECKDEALRQKITETEGYVASQVDWSR